MRIFKFRTPHISEEGRLFSWTSLIYGMGISMLLPIFPNFVESIINSEAYVGFFYSAMSISMVIAGLASSYFFKRYSRLATLYVALFMAGLLAMFFVFVNNFYLLFVIDFIRTFFSLFVMMTLGLFVHDFAKKRDLGKTEGFYFLFNNIGYLIGPIVGGVVASLAGYEPVFVLSGMCLLVALLFVGHQHLLAKHPSLATPPSPTVKKKKGGKLKRFFSNKNRFGAYLISISLVSWMSFKAIFIPLFVVTNGFGSDVSGLIISLAILPCIFFEFPIGKYADKHGVRIPIALGFLIIAFFITAAWAAPVFYLKALFIILANIGGAFIEPLHDVYFFKNVPKEEEDEMIGVFVTADPIGRFIGPGIISISLLLLPFDSVFLVFAGIFALTGLLSFMIKD
jgi:MFS family permease